MYGTVAGVRAKNSFILTLENFPSAQVIEAIQEADAEIDAEIECRYEVPLSSTPTIIKIISERMAAASLLAIGTGQQGQNRNPFQSSDLRRQATETLNRIAKGNLNLTGVIGRTALTSSKATKTSPYKGWTPGDHSCYSAIESRIAVEAAEDLLI